MQNNTVAIKKVLGMCNPLLDITMQTSSKDLLDKYELKEANAILVNEPHPIFTELMNHQTTLTAGGSAQNSMRCLQWMLKRGGDVHFIGCVGDDDFGKSLIRIAAESGVRTHFMVTPEHQTGICASVIYNKDRSLVAHISAAGHYSVDHYKSDPVQSVVNECEILYTTGFFMVTSYETVLSLGQHAHANNKIFILNISATFVIDFYWEQFANILQYADIVCGNEHETLALAKKNNWNTEDYSVIAQKIAQLPKVDNSKKRIVVITQGPKSTMVCDKDEKITDYPVPRIAPEKIVDTNGAGDAFIGGFIAGLSQGKSLAKSIAAGHYCAGVIIQATGVDLTSDCNYNWDE